jgi:hypothetical protein
MSLTVDHRSPFGPLRDDAGTGAGVRRSSWAASIDLVRAESLENRRCSRRVRYEARDALGVVLFSAGASTLVAVLAAVALSWAA